MRCRGDDVIAFFTVINYILCVKKMKIRFITVMFMVIYTVNTAKPYQDSKLDKITIEALKYT